MRVTHEGDLGVRGGALDALDLRADTGDEVAGLDINRAWGHNVIQETNVQKHRPSGAVELTLTDGLVDLTFEVIVPIGWGVGDGAITSEIFNLHAGLTLETGRNAGLPTLAAPFCRGVAGNLARPLPELCHLGGEAAGAISEDGIPEKNHIARCGACHWNRCGDCAAGHHDRGEPREHFRHLLLQHLPIP